MVEKRKSYIRVGTQYYKLVNVPSISGVEKEALVPWNIETIRQDHGKTFLAAIPKYDGFTCIPDHLDFKSSCHNFYNTYAPLNHVLEKGACTTSLSFVKHIFGAHYELGLDYLQLLFIKPTQILPILCLVSRERSTGKSTFLKWLKLIFENNLTYLTNDSFTSQFNADWANKLLICIDEVLFNKEELTERIKYLSTTNINKLEAKGKDKREVEFFGKFILCSNNEENFIKIDHHETRFWVLQVPVIKKEQTEFLKSLAKEIPAFLFYLKNRKLHSRHQTRMWFSADQIETPALKKLVQNNRNRVERELANILLMVMENQDLEELNLCPMDAYNAISKSRLRTDLTQIRKILKKDWKLENQPNSNRYQKFLLWGDGSTSFIEAKGRYFTINKNFLLENFEDDKFS
ncbi:primase-helicase family protein [Salinimicrobium sp. TIG7-5_MAKvit]|uniref:primase-helicase family protein n=1 Tax=Salinimicrobium sp. TIG7-5_MAKvit TaxID=3121289 RepID=UPI003C6DEF0C